METVLLALLCLSGWFILPSCPLRQYYFVNQPLSWHEAQTYCRERFSDLATIDNMTELNHLMDTVSTAGYNSDLWIGAFAEINWMWSDGSEKMYYRWLDVEPKCLTTCFCVAVAKRGRWLAYPCQMPLPYLCYTGSQQDPTFVLVENLPGNWLYAQKYCRENYIDLAMDRTYSDNFRIYEKTLDLTGYAWIGLIRDPMYNWSDGSSFVFQHFDDHSNKQYGSDRVYCGSTSVSASGKWSFTFCERKLPFVCNTPAVRRVVKLRIKLDDSSVDPNDPAVKAALLKKLQDRLKEEGVNGVNLKWREQPDGEVWHQEDL